jgi:hypothetical protein
VEALEDRTLLSYNFQALAFLGDPLPGGGTFVFDFEPGRINNKGEVAFGADVSTGGEGTFLFSKGQITELARTGGAAPGGGIYDFGFLGPVTLNDQGDMAFDFLLSPLSFPFGVNTGSYRYSHATRTLTPVVVPGVTPVPGGGVFTGVFFAPNLNNRGDLFFPGIVETELGVHVPGEEYIGLGIGIYRASRSGEITPVVVPGDPAPGGGTFDLAHLLWANDGGDVAFQGHVAGEECLIPGNPPQEVLIACLPSLYVKDAARGLVRSVAHAGDPAPGGGVFRSVLNQVMNNRGDIAFTGDLTPAPDAGLELGVFLHSGGVTIPIARPGDPMPGGGTLVRTSGTGSNVHVNNRGEVAFSAVLDTDVNDDDILDTGLFVWSRGEQRLVARSGTVIPGLGTVQHLQLQGIVIPPPPIFVPNSAALGNDRGQVLFVAQVEDQGVEKVVLLVATPTGKKPLQLSGEASGDALVGQLLTEEALRPVVEEAIARWSAIGLDEAQLALLAGMDVQVGDLPGSLLGTAYADRIVLDHDAAGFGWSSDRDAPESLASRGVDLLSALAHEFGHVLGLDHDVMGTALGVGMRDLHYLHDVRDPLGGLGSATVVRKSGDANQDGRFDQLDLVTILASGKYRTGQPADWTEGDWNGDVVFDQLDIVAALQTGNYRKGPYAASVVDFVFSEG